LRISGLAKITGAIAVGVLLQPARILTGSAAALPAARVMTERTARLVATRIDFSNSN